MDIAAIGLRQDLDRLQTVSQNVANLGTTAYKRQVAVQRPFADVLSAEASTQVTTDPRAGKLNATGAALDVALPEGHYLALELSDGRQGLTRLGALQLDADGSLRTLGGHAVLGRNGRITLKPDQRDGVEVDAQGQLRLHGLLLDALQLVTLKRADALQPLGEGVFLADAGQWQTASPTQGVRSGHLEQPNVTPSQEMVQLMATTRHAESMVRVFQAADDMQATAIRRFGENN